MSKYIQRYVNTCELCQRNKARQTKPPGLLQPLEIPEGRWIDISMDFMTALPRTEAGKDAIMVIVDRLTKRAKFIASKTSATAEETATLFMVNYVKDHGTDGQTDRTNRFVEDYLRGVVNPAQNDWEEYLHLAEFAYNRRARCTARDPEFEHLNKSAQDFLLKQDTQLKIEQDAMSEAQTRMKSYYDKNRLVQDFSVGDLLSKGLKLHPVFHTSLLKPYHNDKSRPQKVSKVLLTDGTEGQLVHKVIGHRRVKKRLQYKIWWLGETREDATWEP
ncbi:Retrotransposon protein, Ty3-gypsy subclass, partial [Phytophthora palmivora]